MNQPLYTYYFSVNGGAFRKVHITHTNAHQRDRQRVSGKRYHRLDIAQSFTIGPRGGYHDVVSGGLSNVYRIVIKEQLGSGEVTYYPGKFVKTDCDIDEDNLILTVKLSPDDQYTNYLEQVDTELDLVKLGIPVQSLVYNRYPALQLYALTSNESQNVINGILSNNQVEPTYGSSTLRDELKFSPATKLLYIPYRSDYPVDISGLYYPVGNTINGPIESRYRRAAGGYRLEVTGVWNVYNNAGDLIAQNTISDNFNALNPDAPTAVILNLAFTAAPEVKAHGSYIALHGRFAFFEETNWPAPSNGPVQGDQFALGGAYNRTAPFQMSIVHWIGYSDTDQGYGKYSEWGDYPNAGKYVTRPAAGQSSINYIPVGRSTWANVSWWILWGINEQTLTFQNRLEVVLNDAYPLAGVISSMLGEISPETIFDDSAASSELFFGGSNPVTGETRLNYFITPVSNIVVYNYDEAASSAKLKFSELMSALNFMFQADEIIDGNRMRIEAAPFFEGGNTYSNVPGVGLDFTTLKNPFSGRPWAVEANRYTYRKSTIPERLIFGWANQVSESFNGQDIVITNPHVNKGATEDRKITKFVTDLQYAAVKPGAFASNEVFFMLACRVDESGRQVVAESNVPGFGMLQNGALSWPYLHDRYYLHNMPGSDLIINGLTRQAESTRKIKEQKIDGPVPSNFNLLTLIKTGVGAGEVETSSENMESKVSQNTLLHGND